MKGSGGVSSGLTDRSADSWPWMESHSGYRQGQKDSSRSPSSGEAARRSPPPWGWVCHRDLPAVQSPTEAAGASPTLPLWGEGLRGALANHHQICSLLCSLFFLGKRHIVHWGLHKAKQLQCQMEIQQALRKMYCSLCTGCRLGRGGPGHNAGASWEAHQTMVRVWKGEQINQDQGISQLLFLKKDSIARKQSTHKNNT